MSSRDRPTYLGAMISRGMIYHACLNKTKPMRDIRDISDFPGGRQSHRPPSVPTLCMSRMAKSRAPTFASLRTSHSSTAIGSAPCQARCHAKLAGMQSSPANASNWGHIGGT